MDERETDHSEPLPVAAIPTPPQALPLTYATARFLPYVSPASWGRAAIRWTWVAVVFEILLLWPNLVTLLDRVTYAHGGEYPDRVFYRSLMRTGIDLVGGVITLVALVCWLVWVHRTYRNLPSLGAEGLRFSPGWAVAYYFIPIVHLFRPFQVMRETSQASHPDHEGGTSWRAVPAARMINWWWALTLLLIVAAIASWRFEIQEDRPWAYVTASSIDLALILLNVVVLLVEIRIVRHITEHQELRAGRVGTLQDSISQ